MPQPVPPSLLAEPHRKPAPVDHPVLDLVRLRWSPRAFANLDVPAPELRTLFEAARWAMSSNNEQPWGFVAASRHRDAEAFARLLGSLNPGNRGWAAAAPVLVLAAVRRDWSTKPGRNRTAEYDLGQAVAFLTLQATALGLAVHQMAGLDLEAARDAAGLPPGWDPMTMIAIGRPGDPATLDETQRPREAAPRTRRPQAEFAFRGAWGGSHDGGGTGSGTGSGGGGSGGADGGGASGGA